MARGQATFLGFGAILMWALLALLTDLSGPVPPFQLAAMTFGIGGLAGLGLMLWRGRPLSTLWQRPLVWFLGVGGLFGYHFLYFTALQAAPPAEASLIAFLWPLLIVLGSALVTGEGLKRHHLAGALFGLAGAASLVLKPGWILPDPAYLTGYLAALAAAFVWAGYSILSRKVATVPNDAVTGFCLVTAALAALAHLAFETTAWPGTPAAWSAVMALGIGPVGLAFFLWDIGMKRGDISLLGAASYLAPLLSTLILLAAGRTGFTLSLAFGCAAITLGAVISTAPSLRRR